jgi:26S proteasome regulatory subunit N7
LHASFLDVFAMRYLFLQLKYICGPHIFKLQFFFQFQLLESYRSLTLEYMAEAFGVTEDYMDGELSR